MPAYQVMRGSGGGGGVAGVRTPENHRAIGFLSNTGPDPLRTSKLPGQNSMFGQSSGHQRNAITMVLRWWVDDGPLIVVFGSSLPS